MKVYQKTYKAALLCIVFVLLLAHQGFAQGPITAKDELGVYYTYDGGLEDSNLEFKRHPTGLGGFVLNIDLIEFEPGPPTGNQFITLMNSGGKVGIGSIVPTYTLDVNGTARASTFIGSGSGLTNLNAANLTGTLPPAMVNQLSNGGWSLHTNNDLFYNDGNVSINTGRQVAQETLDVGGNIQIEPGYGLILSDTEINDFTTPKEGLLMFDEAFFASGQSGAGYFVNDGGGLSVYHTAGWAPVIDGRNMEYLNARFNSMITSGSVGIGTSVLDVGNVLHVGGSAKVDGTLRTEALRITTPADNRLTYTDTNGGELALTGQLLINGNQIGNGFNINSSGTLTASDGTTKTVKNSNFHNTSYFNVAGAFGVEGAASFVGEANFLGAISAEGGGALLGTYVIGNPLTGEGSGGLGTHMIGDVNIGGNGSSALPFSSIISDLAGGLDPANTTLNVHSESTFHGELLVAPRSHVVSGFSGEVLAAKVSPEFREVNVGSHKGSTSFNAHGNFYVRKWTTISEFEGETIADLDEKSWVFKVDIPTGANSIPLVNEVPTVRVGHGNTGWFGHAGHANFEVVGQSDLKHDVNIGEKDKHTLRVHSKDVIIGEAKEESSDLLTVYHRANFHGNLAATKIGISPDPASYDTWSDFVFDADYELRPLAEVQAFIDANHHLPEVPSAKEVAENGIDLYKMDATLLQKVEELTLYILEQEKRIAQLEAKLAAKQD